MNTSEASLINEQPHPRGRRARRRPVSCMAGIVLVLSLLCILAAAALGAAYLIPVQAARLFGKPSARLDPLERVYLSGLLLYQANDLTLPADPYGQEQSFEVTLGESPLSIVSRLQENGLITNGEAFRRYLIYSGLDTTLQAGEYTLSPGMTPLEIAAALQDPTPGEVSVHVLSGWRLEEIAASLPTTGLEFSPEEFLQAASAPPAGHPLAAEIPAGRSLEGFLLPGEYRLPRESDPEQLIRLMLDNFEAQVGEALRASYERQGLTLYEAVTLASIVEREAVVDEEMPLIASVFLNRLAAGIKLDSDPTVQYALGYNDRLQSWWTNPLSAEDLQIPSPYNTYANPGLPPGPIANPGLQALQAVAYPADTPYYYFRAACDGTGRHTFSQTYEEHLNRSCP